MYPVYILDIPLPIGTKLTPNSNPFNYLVFYLRRNWGSIYLYSGIHSNHCSNGPIPHKHIQKQWGLSSTWGQISGEWGLTQKEPNSSSLPVPFYFASTQDWKASFCSSVLVQLQTFFLRKVESWLFQIKGIISS